MKKTSKILIALLLCISFSKVDAILEPTDPTDPTSGLQVPDVIKESFIKKDDKGNIINNAEFKQTAINGIEMIDKITGIEELKEYQQQAAGTVVNNIRANKENDKYYYISAVYDKDMAYGLLTPDQKAIMDKMTSMQYYNTIKDKISFFDARGEYCKGKSSYVKYLKDSKGIAVEEENADDGPVALFNSKSNNVVRLAGTVDEGPTKLYFTALSYTFIEETKTPKGLEKASIIVPMVINLVYNVNPDNTLELTKGRAYQEGPLMIYTPTIDYSDVADVYDKMNDSLLYQYDSSCSQGETATWHDYNCNREGEAVKQSNTDKKASTVSLSESFFAQNSYENCTAIVIDKTSTEDLSKKVEIESFVNGKKEVNVKKNDEVTITVKVYNGSKTPLYTSKVVSKVPADFTLVDNSILKNGKYDETTRTVTWDYDYLDSLNAELFSYKVKAPDNVKDGTSVKTSATLTTNDSEVPIVSDEATMDLGDQTNDNITNPKTGVLTEQLVSVLLAVSVLLVLLFVRKNRIQSI